MKRRNTLCTFLFYINFFFWATFRMIIESFLSVWSRQHLQLIKPVSSKVSISCMNLWEVKPGASLCSVFLCPAGPAGCRHAEPSAYPWITSSHPKQPRETHPDLHSRHTPPLRLPPVFLPLCPPPAALLSVRRRGEFSRRRHGPISSDTVRWTLADFMSNESSANCDHGSRRRAPPLTYLLRAQLMKRRARWEFRAVSVDCVCVAGNIRLPVCACSLHK